MSNIVFYLINIISLYILGIYLKIIYGMESYIPIKEFLKKKNIHITKNRFIIMLFILSVFWGLSLILHYIFISSEKLYKKIKF